MRRPLESVPPRYAVAASIGVAVWEPAQSPTAHADLLLRLADEAMYASKGAGRDRVTMVTAETAPHGSDTSTRRPPTGGGMGTLTYDSTITAEFDDRTLTHLQVVIWSKLRRGEHFAFTFGDEAPPAQRTSVWCSPTIPMVFQFDQPDPAELNTRWLELLTKSANSAAGLRPLQEPEDAS